MALGAVTIVIKRVKIHCFFRQGIPLVLSAINTVIIINRV